MNRDQLLDKIEEITDRNYRTFRGTNEAELHTREEIADLIESLLPQWRPISEIESVDDGALIVVADFLRDIIIDSDLIYFYDYNYKNYMYKKLYTHFLTLPKLTSTTH